MTSDQSRYIETEVLIDRSVKLLCLRKSLIEKLQLEPWRQQSRQTLNSPVKLYSPVTIYLRDRFAMANVEEIPDGSPNLLGRIPLLMMDWVIDAKNEKLIGNPEHDGRWMLEEYYKAEA